MAQAPSSQEVPQGSSASQEDVRWSKFHYLLHYMSQRYDVTCRELPAPERGHPPFSTTVRSQIKFLLTNLSIVNWNVPVMESTYDDATRYLLDQLDIMRARSCSYYSVREFLEKAKKGKPNRFLAMYQDAILEIADCIDSALTGRVDLEKLPYTVTDDRSLTALQALYQHYRSLKLSPPLSPSIQK